MAKNLLCNKLFRNILIVSYMRVNTKLNGIKQVPNIILFLINCIIYVVTIGIVLDGKGN